MVGAFLASSWVVVAAAWLVLCGGWGTRKVVAARFLFCDASKCCCGYLPEGRLAGAWRGPGCASLGGQRAVLGVG